MFQKDAVERRLRQRFFVTPKVGLNFAGVLTEYDKSEKGYQVYRDVVIYPPDSNPEPAEGETFIRHTNVACQQLLPPHVLEAAEDVND